MYIQVSHQRSLKIPKVTNKNQIIQQTTTDGFLCNRKSYLHKQVLIKLVSHQVLKSPLYAGVSKCRFCKYDWPTSIQNYPKAVGRPRGEQ